LASVGGCGAPAASSLFDAPGRDIAGAARSVYTRPSRSKDTRRRAEERARHASSSSSSSSSSSRAEKGSAEAGFFTAARAVPPVMAPVEAKTHDLTSEVRV
jgi:hypothetical protein